MGRDFRPFKPKCIDVFQLAVIVLVLEATLLASGYEQYSFLQPTGYTEYSEPSNFARLGDQLFFSAQDGYHGFELWATDGTVNGTRLFEDIVKGSGSSNPSLLTPAGGRLFFFLFSDYDGPLWVTDGTPEGTRSIPGTEGASSLNKLTVHGNNIVYLKFEEYTGGELWTLDATTLTTTILADIRLGPSSSSPIFKASNGTHSIWLARESDDPESLPWITDGTPEGTFRVVGIPGSVTGTTLVNVWVDGTNFIVVNSGYDSDTKFYRTNGIASTLALTLSNVTVEENVFSGISLRPDLFLFTGDTSAEGWGVYSTDFTLAGTTRIFDPPFDSYIEFVSTTPVHGLAVFTAAGGLYGTDGTKAGTGLLAPGVTNPTVLGWIAGDLLFFATDFTQVHIFRTDGTAQGTKSLWSGVNFSYSGDGTLGSRIFFGCADVYNTELCVTDGTTAGTGLFKVTDKTDLGVPYGITSTNAGNTVAFVYNSSIYLADGTPEGTVKVPNTDYVSSFVAGQGALSDWLFYVDSTSFFKYNPATNATVRISDNVALPSASAGSHILLKRGLGAFAFALYSSDGTPEGTVELGQFTADASFGVWGDYFIFPGVFPGVLSNSGMELLATNGGNVTLVKDINPGRDSSTPRSLTPAPTLGGVVFVADSPSPGLWKTDGTSEGTVFLHELPGAANAYPYMAEVADLGIFLVMPTGIDEGSLVYGVFFYNPTDNTLSDNLKELKGVSFIQVASTGDHFVFLVLLQDLPSQLWTSDGTPEGTVQLQTPAINFVSQSETLVSSPDGRVFFVAWSPVEGEEVWSTRGTPETTFVLPGTAVPGIVGSNPRGLTILADGRLGFVALTPAGTYQVFVYSDSGTVPSIEPSTLPSHAPSHSAAPPSREPLTPSPAAPSSSLSPSPVHPRVLARVLDSSGWLEGGERYEWGDGSCKLKRRLVPSQLPITGAEEVTLGRGTALKIRTDSWKGCGSFYYHEHNDQYLNFTGAKELRFWIRSNVLAKIEFQIGDGLRAPTSSDTDVASEVGQDPSKDYVYVSPTYGQWVQGSVWVGSRTEEELSKVYGPLLVTVLGDGYVMVSNVIVVTY